jgi:hypothetical protein
LNGIFGPAEIEGEKSMRDRKRSRLTMKKLKTALGNGHSLVADNSLDGRSSWARRCRELIDAHCNDLGGFDNMSEAERALVKRGVMLELQLELMEVRFAANNGEASPDQLKSYQTTVNSLRRLWQTLGLRRRPRDVTPTLSEYLARQPRTAGATTITGGSD